MVKAVLMVAGKVETVSGTSWMLPVSMLYRETEKPPKAREALKTVPLVVCGD